jgi:adenosylcobinamide-GDP ribazoletransferase
VADIRNTLNLFARRFTLALHDSTRMRAGEAWSAEAEPGPEPELATTAHLPGVGWLVGIAACLVFAVFSLALGGTAWATLVAAIACTAATATLTGARNESALHRLADQAGGAPGAGHGVLALVLLLSAKFALLAALADASEPAVITALFAALVVSRFMQLLAHWAASAGSDTRSLGVGALWCAVPLALMAAAGGLAFMVVPVALASLACFAFLRWCRSRTDLPGADRPGAVQQVCEVVFYLGAAVAA